jgi:hypothetical protein
MLENGADVRFIQALPGHANLGTTEIYTRVVIVKLKPVHEATHPARLHGPRAGEQAWSPWPAAARYCQPHCGRQRPCLDRVRPT